VLYGKEEWLDRMPPYQGGGEMIESVSFEKTTFEKLPFKFEAGTPDYVATHGLATALNYVSALGMDNIAAHERELTDYCMTRLAEIDGMRLFGTTEGKDAVVSFLVGDIHHLDMGTLLDRLGIAVRTGHHCAQPVMDRFGIQGMVRASFGLYNTKEEVDAAMRSSLEIGDQVTTIGGVIGRVVAIKDDTFVLETGADRVKIRFTKNAISSVEKLNMDNAPKK
jgi:cysteine desulfurase/selenocysteine lyase